MKTLEGDTTSIRIEGKPKPLKRHRSARGRVYDPSREEKENFAWKVKAAIGSQEPLEGPLRLELTFAYVLPKKTSKKQREALQGAYRDSKPDLSNLIKFVEDALNGILWKDDAQIGEIVARKIFSSEEYTLLECSSLSHQPSSL